MLKFVKSLLTYEEMPNIVNFTKEIHEEKKYVGVELMPFLRN